MKITMTSSISGTEHTLDIDITKEQYQRVLNRRENDEKIQNIIPHISQAEREFLITGITPVQWIEIFGENEE